MRTLRDDNILKLPDGRQLCYAEYGDPDGKPVILFHGNPNSRLLYGLVPGCPFRPGLHLIAPDRPGYGFSDFYLPGHGVADYPDDIVALADALGIDKFAVFGASGGGPPALACGGALGQRGAVHTAIRRGYKSGRPPVLSSIIQSALDTPDANGLIVICNTPLSRSLHQACIYRDERNR